MQAAPFGFHLVDQLSSHAAKTIHRLYFVFNTNGIDSHCGPPCTKNTTGHFFPLADRSNPFGFKSQLCTLNPSAPSVQNSSPRSRVFPLRLDSENLVICSTFRNCWGVSNPERRKTSLGEVRDDVVNRMRPLGRGWT